MKPLRRRSWLQRGRKPLKRSWIKRGMKPLPKVNPARMAKRKAAYQTFLRSPAWKAQRAWVLARDGHQCRAMRLTLNDGIYFGVIGERCQARTRLTVHHLHYSARGIAHTPNEALVTVCRRHHDQLEAQKMTHRPR